MSRNSSFEPPRPYVHKKYIHAGAPRNAVRFSRIVLVVLGVGLAIALILALIL